MKYTSPYTPPTLTVDAVIFQIQNNVLEVLLMQRPNEPFKGAWALPGGYNAQGETTTDALHRIVEQKTGVDVEKDLSYLEQLYTFDTVDRDPRGHAVSVTYMGGGRDITVRNSDHHVAFMPVDNLPDLAYDHASIVRYAHERFIAKLTYTNAVAAFLPRRFTLSQLQSTYEIIFGREFDKRNFRKKFLSLNLIHETNETWRDGAHRPAKLYEFNSKKLESLSRSFD
ncbi:TPA: DNA mismatch repair protein MutT [Candidatus Saccharibacteria bacterium]|nr:DNA mismatch repair protein MutT [Candidatus Saccharibacteria bacterium]HRK40700.1 NUDIX domain-containing protein [Candidatus Saccharibacteria bacterium]